jgi:F420-dependent oxidoreductase-like protein
MRIGLTIPDLTWPGGAAQLGPTLARIASTADEAGFSHIALMDHLFQIPNVGAVENEMIEPYTALGFLAAHTQRATLLTLVTGVTYRHPGLLAKIATTLDVLCGGRSMLGIGAGWYEAEARGLGLPMPSLGERFEQLEETVEIVLRMWSEDESPYLGKHYRLERPLNSPQPIATPHPPLMIGGSGEKKTLRLVAKYAQACNLFPSPALGHKLDVLRGHCEREGRDYDAIEKTCYLPFTLGADGQGLDALVKTLGWLGNFGIQTVIGSVTDVWQVGRLELIGREVIPAVAEL